MTDTAAIFVTDRGFLVPTLVAAQQLLDFDIGKRADILIYTVDLPDEIQAKLKHDFAPQMQIRALDDRSFLPDNLSGFHRNHVPTTTLARLVLGPHIDASYANLVYIDGDVQILRNPAPLFDLRLPDGVIGAAPGSAWLYDIEGAPQYENIEALDLNPRTYFNAGILAFTRTTWLEKGPEALRFFLGNPEKCKIHDQTALNVVFRDAILGLSPVYNFEKIYWEAGAHRLVSPRIVHFTGPHKPWSGFPAPWYGQFRHVYRKMVLAHPYLAGMIRITPRFSGDALRARIKRVIRTDRARFAARRRAIKARIDQGFDLN